MPKHLEILVPWIYDKTNYGGLVFLNGVKVEPLTYKHLKKTSFFLIPFFLTTSWKYPFNNNQNISWSILQLHDAFILLGFSKINCIYIQ